MTMQKLSSTGHVDLVISLPTLQMFRCTNIIQNQIISFIKIFSQKSAVVNPPDVVEPLEEIVETVTEAVTNGVDEKETTTAPKLQYPVYQVIYYPSSIIYPTPQLVPTVPTSNLI